MPRLFESTRYLVAILAAVLFTSAALGRSAASEPCSAPNIMAAPVCDMDSFYATDVGEAPEGWTPFVLSGNPVYSEDVDTYWGPPSLRIRVFDEAFKAGIYTQVAVQPGAGYRASVAWGAPNQPDAFGRQLGLDPTGGTDPNGPNVIWGPMHWGDGRMLNYPPPDVNIDVRARATGDTMTVFFLVDHIANPGDNLIFIDAISLTPDESANSLEPPVGPLEQSALLPLLAHRDEPTPQPTGTPAPTSSWSEPLLVAGSRDMGVNALFGSQPAAIESDDSLLIAYSLDHGDGGQSGEDEAFVRQNVASAGWQSPVPISDVASGESAGAPSLLLDANMRGHLLWSVGGRGQEELDFEYTRRVGGSTWSTPEPAPTLVDYGTVGQSGTHHLVEVGDDAIDVVWLGKTDNLNEVHWATRDQTGWSGAATISPVTDDFGVFFPGVVRASDSTVHVLWHEFAGETQYAMRDATTGGWTAPMTATQKGAMYHMLAPGDAGDAHLLRQNEFRLAYTHKDRDADWKKAFLTSEPVAVEDIGPYYGASSLAVDAEGNPHVAWISGAELRYAARDPIAGWSTPITLFDRSAEAPVHLYLFADRSGRLHLLWREVGEIWYSTTSDAFR